jgi:site-specific DNA recombinase
VRNIGINKESKTIPATLTRFTASPITEQKKRRVAGYARVSTDHDDQFTSYEAQIDYYTNYIKSRDDWEFVEVYTDEGITGTSTKRREGFKTMVADALAGKIDLIVTKSVSRFARNTVDSLTTIRQLKEKGIEVYFEKENIWTFDGKGELLITIMSSLAQEESRSISENCTWGQRKRFADGKVTIPFNRFLGYDRGAGRQSGGQSGAGQLPSGAFTSMFLQGMTYNGIAQELTEDGIKTRAARTNGAFPRSEASSATRSTRAMPCCRSPSRSTYLTKKKRSTKAKSRSTMWKETTRPSLTRLTCSTWCSGKWQARQGQEIPQRRTSLLQQDQMRRVRQLVRLKGLALRQTNTGRSSGSATTSTMATSTAALRT